MNEDRIRELKRMARGASVDDATELHQEVVKEVKALVEVLGMLELIIGAVDPYQPKIHPQGGYVPDSPKLSDPPSEEIKEIAVLVSTLMQRVPVVLGLPPLMSSSSSPEAIYSVIEMLQGVIRGMSIPGGPAPEPTPPE